MIKANELRIGNVVTNEEWGGFHKVQGIEVKDKGWELKINGFVHDMNINYHNIKPIPLTKEILIACGFEEPPHDTILSGMFIYIGRDRHLSVSCLGTSNEMVFLCHKGMATNAIAQDAICIHNYDFDGSLSLHQLQNLYFMLTNEELEINYKDLK